MTSQPPVPDRAGDHGPAASDDEPIRVPEWMGQPRVEHPAGGPERLRLFVAEHSRAVFTVVGAVLAVAVLATAGWLGVREGAPETPRAYPTVSHPAGVHATTEATPAAPADAFAGTPAVSFPEGAAGITLPPARRTGAFSAKQVEEGLTKVRAALILARLDRGFLAGDHQDRFLAMFALDARADLRRDFADGAFATYATRLAPGARLTRDQPRVKGRVTYRATRDPDGIRVLEITTNFVWVYPFPTDDPTPGAGVVVVHDTVVWQVTHPSDVTAKSHGLWIEESESYGSNVDCAAFEKGLIGLGTLSVVGPEETEDPDAMFDPNRSLDIADTC